MFNFRHKGYGLLLPTIACAALIGGVAVGITKMSNVSVKAVTSTKTKYTGQQYALNTADKYCRLTNYASLAGFEKRKIDGSDDYYEEVIITDNTVPLFQGSVETGSAPSKDITVNVYHKEGERMPLVSSVKLYRTDPATFDPSFNMVANDAASTSENQALSANAFREMLNSKVSGNIAFGSDVAMSANASKLYIDSVLKNYALTDSSVGIKDLNDAGTAHRGVYVDAEGFIKPTDIIIRGNKSTEADPLILIPVKLPDGSWAFDSLRKSKLGKGANQTYTVSIKQTPNQTITVTTSDGTKHTSDFTAKVGTTWTATVDADTGYNAGKLIASSGTVNGATTVSATEATIKTFDFNITQSAHQTITVTTGDGVKHTSSFVAKYGTTWTAQVVADGSNGDSSGAVNLPVGEQVLWLTDNDMSKDGDFNLVIPEGCNVIKCNSFVDNRGSANWNDGQYFMYVYVKNKDTGKSWVSLEAGEKDGSSSITYIGVTSGATYNMNAALYGEVDDSGKFYSKISYSKSINEHTPDIEDYISGSGSGSSGSGSSGYTAGNLIVNGTDTGSSTGNGIVTGTMNVSATAAGVPDKETVLGTGEGTYIVPAGVKILHIECEIYPRYRDHGGNSGHLFVNGKEIAREDFLENGDYNTIVWVDAYIEVTPGENISISATNEFKELSISYSKSINEKLPSVSSGIY